MVRRLLAAGGRRPDDKDIELLLLRHQLKVLQRQVKRPRRNRLDKVLLAAASRAMMSRGELMKLEIRISATTVRTILLRHVLFFIELSTRRVQLAGVSAQPDWAWVTQQATKLAIEERLWGVRFLLRDRDATFSGALDDVLRAEGLRVMRTPIRSPRANAFRGAVRLGPCAERAVTTS